MVMPAHSQQLQWNTENNGISVGRDASWSRSVVGSGKLCGPQTVL